MEKRNGGDAMHARYQGNTEVPPKLNDLGITRVESSHWQQIAALPQKKFEQVIAETKSKESELTSAEMLRVAQGNRKARDDGRTLLLRGDAIHRMRRTFRIE